MPPAAKYRSESGEIRGGPEPKQSLYSTGACFPPPPRDGMADGISGRHLDLSIEARQMKIPPSLPPNGWKWFLLNQMGSGAARQNSVQYRRASP